MSLNFIIELKHILNEKYQEKEYKLLEGGVIEDDEDLATVISEAMKLSFDALEAKDIDPAEFEFRVRFIA